MPLEYHGQSAYITTHGDPTVSEVAMAKAAGRKLGILWLFFSPVGRVSREPFWLAMALMWCVMFLAFYVSAGTVLNQADAQTPTADLINMVMASNGMLPIMVMLSKWFEVALVVKRLHDRGWSGLFALLVFLPLLSIPVVLFVGLQPSQPGANRFGPRPNSVPERKGST
ncbi:DUF805 domain-containing protein [Pseudovibrio sp. SPO723]|uniref:DUF805 domain-containing protein n=1 Tax=Nesiotobacter zosterae TaxID=392721 RepID=UPI0029C5C95B|nr:DUF805 domain-containing protein [Pseudovibrio sp. SPO723]MDX5592355.1 DUF805 domain-containing protein [Pseudovibrio sp. SPO723]